MSCAGPHLACQRPGWCPLLLQLHTQRCIPLPAGSWRSSRPLRDPHLPHAWGPPAAPHWGPQSPAATYLQHPVGFAIRACVAAALSVHTGIVVHGWYAGKGPVYSSACPYQTTKKKKQLLRVRNQGNENLACIPTLASSTKQQNLHNTSRNTVDQKCCAQLTEHGQWLDMQLLIPLLRQQLRLPLSNPKTRPGVAVPAHHAAPAGVQRHTHPQGAPGFACSKVVHSSCCC
jgi:hypothetical protein